MALVALDGFSVTNSCAWHWGVTCLKLGSFQGGGRFFYTRGCIAMRGDLNMCSILLAELGRHSDASGAAHTDQTYCTETRTDVF